MLHDRKIAVFIDVDNAVLEYSHYDNAMQQLKEMGEIVCATVYGASERKHKLVIEDAKNNGYAIQLPSRTRRRVRKVFDDRIWVDVATLVSQNKVVDTVAIISHPTDMVYLFSYLRRLGLQVVSTDNLDDQSLALVSQTVDLGKVETIKLPKKKAAPKKQPAAKAAAKPAAAPKKQSSDATEDRTMALLREIEKLREGYDKPAKKSAPVEKPVEEPAPVEQPAEEPQPGIVEETQNLMDKIASLREEAPVEQPAPAEQPAPVEEAPRASYVSQNDSDLIRRIEELRNQSNGDSDEMVAEIKKLLDGLE